MQRIESIKFYINFLHLVFFLHFYHRNQPLQLKKNLSLSDDEGETRKKGLRICTKITFLFHGKIKGKICFNDVTNFMNVSFFSLFYFIRHSTLCLKNIGGYWWKEVSPLSLHPFYCLTTFAIKLYFSVEKKRKNFFNS